MNAREPRCTNDSSSENGCRASLRGLLGRSRRRGAERVEGAPTGQFGAVRDRDNVRFQMEYVF